MFFAALVLLLSATFTEAQADLATPSPSAAPSPAPTVDPTAAPSVAPEDKDYCNICGQGNFIGFPTGIVSFEYEGEQRTNNCQTWQTIVMNPVAISDEFCRNDMLMYTLDVSLT